MCVSECVFLPVFLECGSFVHSFALTYTDRERETEIQVLLLHEQLVRELMLMLVALNTHSIACALLALK